MVCNIFKCLKNRIKILKKVFKTFYIEINKLKNNIKLKLLRISNYKIIFNKLFW